MQDQHFYKSPTIVSNALPINITLNEGALLIFFTVMGMGLKFLTQVGLFFMLLGSGRDISLKNTKFLKFLLLRDKKNLFR